MIQGKEYLFIHLYMKVILSKIVLTAQRQGILLLYSCTSQAWRVRREA